MPMALEAVNKHKDNLGALIKEFGERPGGYRLDPYWFRRGIGNKPYVWNQQDKKWRLINVGDEFDLDEEGNVVCVSRSLTP